MIYNFRDSKLVGMKQKMLWRSATLDDLDEKEQEEILRQINCILDLRGDGEGKSRAGSIYELYNTEEKRLHKINLAKPIRIAVWNSIDFITKIWYIIYMIFQWRLSAKMLVFKNSLLRREGLVGLYKAFLLHSQTHFQKVFTILQDPANYPVLIHCSAGKDRTGLTIALIQSLMGCEKDAIAENYRISSNNLDMARIKREITAFGLGEEFAETPKEVMIEILDFIESKYGSTSSYLMEAGIDLQAQAAVIAILQDEGYAKL